MPFKRSPESIGFATKKNMILTKNRLITGKIYFFEIQMHPVITLKNQFGFWGTTSFALLRR
jgi:hypothetical protein